MSLLGADADWRQFSIFEPVVSRKMSEESTKSPILISEIHLQNLLSFGPDAKPIPLGPLNVLIGPNGSGKSNLIEAIGLIRETTRDLRSAISNGGGIEEWIWKGKPLETASISLILPNKSDGYEIHFSIGVRSERQNFQVAFEKVVADDPDLPFDLFIYDFRGNTTGEVHSSRLSYSEEVPIEPDQSVLSQIKDPKHYPELWFAGDRFSRICFFRIWQFGRQSALRFPQKTDLRNDLLNEDFSNLGMVLNRLLNTKKSKNAFISALTDLYGGLTDIHLSLFGGTIQIILEEGDFSIPATRLSDGTLRYLCLLCILLDPTPPPLICIEEPELGMHPDIIVKIADLMVEASTRTQLIVTTHSDIILDALSNRPESILVCEKHDGKTEITRLDAESVKPFLEHRSLGDMWNSNIIGGRRW